MSGNDRSIVSDIACFAVAAVFVLGLLVLAVRLKDVQVDATADYSYANVRQSVRRVQTAGIRGRILDRRGTVLAGGRVSVSIVCDATFFQRRNWEETATAITAAVARVSSALDRPSLVEYRRVLRHIHQRLSRPLPVWRDVDHALLARFLEHADDFPGFGCVETHERTYPLGSLAAHAIGYVGRAEVMSEAGDAKFNFRDRDLVGRSGLELYYDAFLRGVPGERRLLVDARGFAVREWTVTEPQAGPDLAVTLDAALQRAVERELDGEKGACVVLDPRTGEILALASAPTFDLGDCVPVFAREAVERLLADADRPIWNRATAGRYEPGSTFKPITALAALSAGVPADHMHECTGAFSMGARKLRCTRRWGHGPLAMTDALKYSCNPFFCSLGVDIGTNALATASRAFGLGSPTGVDYSPEAAGLVSVGGVSWRLGDLAQMSIGQGRTLATPLQMACVAGALGTGCLVRPHFKLGLESVRTPLPFSRAHLNVVRQGMYKVVNDSDGTGRNGGRGLKVKICGKTGTAEVGEGANRRNNTWFIAYAPAENPSVAVAMVIENGRSGGGTTAPKVRNILASIFGEEEKEELGDAR